MLGSMERVTQSSASEAMSSPARDYDNHAPIFTSGDRIAVPLNAVELLRESIRTRQDGRALDEKIRSAAALICDEARRTDAIPEMLVLSVKEICHSLPEYESISGARERDAFVSSVVTLAIEEYYRG